jgi:alginate O-acetyltransferase complex protein AlgJ
MTKTEEKKTNQIFDIISIVLFLLAICLPIVGSIFKLGTTSEEMIADSEQRTAAVFPKLEWSFASLEKFPSQFEAYYNDNFGFRQPLIIGLNYFKVFKLGGSSSPTVILGKDGWLFYANEESRQYYLRSTLFTPQELASWKTVLEERHNWLASQGIRYLFVITPNKDTIYPEFFPEYIHLPKTDSRLDQLIKYLKANSNVEILDLRGRLWDSKKINRIYSKTDTHWNQLGAFFGYQEIITHITPWFSKIKPARLNDFEIHLITRQDGDLARMLALANYYKEDDWELKPRFNRLAHKVDAGLIRPNVPADKQPFATEVEDSNLPRAVMFHDSFTNALKPFLSENFNRILYLRQYDFEPDIIEKESPNIVIEQMVERNLISYQPEKMKIISNGVKRKQRI